MGTRRLMATAIAGISALLLPGAVIPAVGDSHTSEGQDEQVSVGSQTHADAVAIDMQELPPPGRPVAPPPGVIGTAEEVDVAAEDQGDELEGTYSQQGSDVGAAVVDEAFTVPDPNFDGIGNVANPADPNIDVGLDHVVQMVNVSIQIWEKDGTNALGPFTLNSLWQAAGVGTICNTTNNGDPVVVYDHLEDRWVLSQFAIPNGFQGDPTGFCVAISQTPDPTDGLWYLYEFVFSDNAANNPDAPQINFDYPKLSVWPDAFYLSSQRGYPGGSIDVWAFDRANMLNGNPTTFQRFNLGSPALMVLPSDLDGTPPPAGTPAIFARHVDGDLWNPETGDSTDRVELFEFDVDWSDPTNSSITTLADLPTAGFDSGLCNPKNLFDNCVPQPDGGTTLLETLPNWPLFRLQFRQWDDHQSLVFNHTVDADGTGHAGIRWYELRRPDGGGWSIHQQGTYSPDGGNPGLGDDPHRWMGSVAMDKAGNMALGYSASSATLNPSVWYTGRRAGDPLGLMPAPESTMITGTGTVGSSRWGDYTSMVVDPVDDCTFWYTAEYGSATGGRDTRIGSFRFSDCNEADLSITKSDRQDPAIAGDQLIYDVTVRNHGPDTAFGVEVVDTLPLGLDYVTDTAGCTLSVGSGPNGEDQLTCDLGDIPSGQAVTFSIRLAVPDDFVVASGPTGIENTATVSSDWVDPDLSNNTATETTIIDESADLEVAKICKPDEPLRAGEIGFCDIFVDNNGPSASRDVVLVDQIETDTTLTSLTATSSQGSCTVTDLTVECDLDDVGAQDRATVHVEFSADEPGDVNDIATVSADTPDPDNSNNEATESVSIEGVSDLALSKADSPDPVVAGEQLTYTLTVSNDGPSTAQNVVVTDMLSDDVTIDSVSGSGGASCTAGVPGDPAAPATCSFGSLAPGGSETMTILVTVLADTLGTIHNDARATNDHLDPDNSNDTATVATQVNGESDLAVAKADFPDPATAGDGLSYQLTLVNHGPSTSHGVVVRDSLPDEVVFESATIANADGTCVLLDTPPNTVSCELATVHPNALDPVVITIETGVLASVPDGTVIVNTATVSSSTTDPDASNDTATEETTIQAISDVQVFKTSDKDVYSPSDNIVYTVSAFNGGPSDAQDVVLVDSLPLTDKKVVDVHNDQGCTYDPSPAHTVTCDVGTLAAGATFAVQITIAVKGNVGTITNEADVTTTTTDPDLTNNHVSYDVTVTGGPGKGNNGQGGGGPG